MYFNLQKVRLMNKIKNPVTYNLPKAIIKPLGSALKLAAKPAIIAKVSAPKPGGCGCSRSAKLGLNSIT
jgi:hypothetical protein